MVCRCSSPAMHAARASEFAASSARYEEERNQQKIKKLEQTIASMSPDPTRYEIIDAVEAGPHLVVKAKFPSCSACAYEGNKVLVYLNVKALDAIKWKKLDPHFRPDKAAIYEAPSPAARFPASDEGWRDALAFANSKNPLLFANK